MSRTTASVDTETQTIHTLYVTLTDGALESVDFGGDIVQVVLTYRNGQSTAKRLTYGDLHRMMGEGKGSRL